MIREARGTDLRRMGEISVTSDVHTLLLLDNIKWRASSNQPSVYLSPQHGAKRVIRDRDSREKSFRCRFPNVWASTSKAVWDMFAAREGEEGKSHTFTRRSIQGRI